MCPTLISWPLLCSTAVTENSMYSFKLFHWLKTSLWVYSTMWNNFWTIVTCGWKHSWSVVQQHGCYERWGKGLLALFKDINKCAGCTPCAAHFFNLVREKAASTVVNHVGILRQLFSFQVLLINGVFYIHILTWIEKKSKCNIMHCPF